MEPKVEEKPAAAKPETRSAGQDLSKDIERSIERQPFDRVKVVHLFDSYYRCNWWAPAVGEVKNPGFDWAVATTHHVRKSKFVNASWNEGQLVIAER